MTAQSGPADVSDVSEAEVEAAARAICDGRSDDWWRKDDRYNARADARAALQAAAAVRAQVGDEGPRAFVLQRDEDVSGVSGTGIVAEGICFSDGTVSLRWTSAWPTSVVFHDRGMESVAAVHGHDGRTKVVWL